jgi:hypothetical protein
MSRLADAILQSGTAFAQGKKAAMLNPIYGGQHGLAPDLSEWVSNQAYVRRNLICLLVEAPKGFQYLPNPDQWVATLRAAVELHAISIDGLNQTLDVETTETPVGGGGEVQEDFVDVKRQRSQPVIRIPEKVGMPFANFFGGWIRNLIMDPDTKYPAIATLAKVPPDMLADMYSATMLFIEPDALHDKVVKSWLVTNMYPKNSGEITGRRDLTAAHEAVTHDINFTGIAQSGVGVDDFAQKVLDGMKITGANPYLRPAFVDKISADLTSTQKSYSRGVADLAANAIKL